MRLLVILMLSVGCDRQNFVQLVPVELGEDPTTGSGGPAGFTCRAQCPCSDGSSQCTCLWFDRASDAARPS
ncbi:MAG TPA: hypothetical protein VGH63_11185, partial [Polyangia bacterium]